MAQSTTLNNVTFSIPDPGDTGAWGANLTAFFVAISPAVLQKSGGLFAITSDVDFGASFGLKSLYFSSRNANPASAGNLRLSNTDLIAFRNFANSGNLTISTDSSDNLTFNGTKVTISGAIVNADISPSAAIAYSKLNLSNSIVNADINTSAAIAFSKLAALTANRALQSDGSGIVSVSATTAAELAFVSGVTSSIQAQIDTKAADASVVHLAGSETVTGSKNFSAAAGNPIHGTNTNDTAATGYVGERITSTATVTLVTTGYTTITSIDLTAGTWDISTTAFSRANTGVIEVITGIATATNSNTGHILGFNAGASTPSTATDDSFSVPAVRVHINATTTYYLTGQSFGANSNTTGTISAVRPR